ncbi:PREDICTED: glutamyl aminopeptidase-like isoform X1 [Amphimedon queenslandica]|uniref:Aminopeptidase n=1 Tax=Amphimedon queenslandica TaxID=400682 RepID=A0AAN0IDK8_AMPQE|nr:PREDICTED: glutamyl aminopeptidase-like isoform X1 [Amphimedon queenslandica]|eukprot:XP_003386159.1 PREDICTED: glutamyl aminopeptidase-like isoform X1 [Amphimedon queenslandica]
MSRHRNGFEQLDGESSDTDMNLEDNESSALTGKKKRYLVNDEEGPLCSPGSLKLSKRELICILIGGIIIIVAAIVFVIIAVVLSRSSGNGSPGGSDDKPWTNVRLPKTLTPALYRVSLDTDLNTFRVNGFVSVDISVNQSTDLVIFHAKDMTLNTVSLTKGVRGDQLGISRQFFYSDNDFYVIQLADSLDTNDNLQLNISFNYTLRDDLVGFYKSSYSLADNEVHYLATTQFEPTDARRAFPCFDEPAMKANFSIELTHANRYNAVSNMPVARRVSKANDKATTSFNTSYKMSTYLVAFVISDFNCSDSQTVNGHIQVRVCARPDVFSDTSYALSVGKSVIGYYEEFFGVQYPLPKQDLFAIPDFAVGAMENWGLITYRETALLYNSTQNPAVNKQRVAVVVAHELAHQWFGNLVTMSWWDGLWLNEGFASYVEYIGTDHVQPDWMMLEQFFIDTVQTAYDADGLNWSHPIIQQVNNPDEINGLFDSISYDKGASLIQMLRGYIGNESFTNGLTLYLKNNKFGNTETYELWDALNEVSSSDVSVSQMMDTWTKQMGYPVVTVSASDNNRATVSQKRFFQIPLPEGEQPAASPYNYVWIIPFDYITENGNSVTKKLVSNQQDTITWDSSNDGFIKANANQTGFYRVNYDVGNWQSITAHLMTPPNNRPQILSAVDRAGLLEDAFSLSTSGLLNITVALNLSRYLVNEEDYAPWMTALRWFSIFSDKLSTNGQYGNFKRYVSSLMGNITRKLSFNKTGLSHLQILLRTYVLLSGYKYGDISIADTSLTMFRNWMTDGISVPPDLRLVVYRVAIAAGGETEWNYLWSWYKNTTNPYEKQICLSALAQSKEYWILSRYLEYSMSQVRSQDTLYVIRSVARNVNGRYLAWNFVRDNYDTIFKKYGGGSFSFSRLIRSITGSFATSWELQEVESFFGKVDVGSASLALQQSKEIVRGNIAWLDNNESVIGEWMNEYLSGAMSA